MPSAPMRFCAAPGCPARVTSGRCAHHQKEQRHHVNWSAGHRWYKTKRWERLKADVWRAEPFCRDCGVRATEDVDHIVPHGGDERLFFDRANLAGRCKGCHSIKTRRGE